MTITLVTIQNLINFSIQPVFDVDFEQLSSELTFVGKFI